MNITTSFVKCYRYFEKNAVFRKKRMPLHTLIRSLTSIAKNLSLIHISQIKKQSNETKKEFTESLFYFSLSLFR